jgi:hypothetical protein
MIKTIIGQIRNTIDKEPDITLMPNGCWIYDENGNAGIIEVEIKNKKALLRGKDLNTGVIFCRGKSVTKKNILRIFELADQWNSKDRGYTYEYHVKWWLNDEEEDE